MKLFIYHPDYPEKIKTDEGETDNPEKMLDLEKDIERFFELVEEKDAFIELSDEELKNEIIRSINSVFDRISHYLEEDPKLEAFIITRSGKKLSLFSVSEEK